MSESMNGTDLRTVPFHGDEIVTFENGGSRWVAMRRIIENMGLNWASQSVKLSEQAAKFNCCDIATVGADGKPREMVSMPIEKLPLWLASINPTKIKNGIVRTKVERYQAESAIALHDYWTKGVALRSDLEGIVTGLDPSVARVIGGIVKAVVTRALGTVLPEMVRAQLAHGMAIRNGRTAGQIWNEHGLPPLKNGPQWLANRLQEMGAASENGACGELGGKSARMFDHDKANACMRNGLRQRAERYIAERRGQGALHLVPPVHCPF
jgi:P22_AR N-terminal domain